MPHYRFDGSQRLHGDAAFVALLKQGTKKTVGFLTMLSAANDVGKLRVGLRTPRAIGNAVRRNRVRRLLREAFRTMQHDFPFGTDVLILVRPHAPVGLADYQRLLSKLLVSLRPTDPISIPPQTQ